MKINSINFVYPKFDFRLFSFSDSLTFLICLKLDTNRTFNNTKSFFKFEFFKISQCLETVGTNISEIVDKIKSKEAKNKNDN